MRSDYRLEMEPTQLIGSYRVEPVMRREVLEFRPHCIATPQRTGGDSPDPDECGQAGPDPFSPFQRPRWLLRSGR